MTSTAFAALEARINAACTQHLANAVATYNGGPAFGVLFTRAGDDPFDGALDVASHACSFDLANAPGLATKHELVIDSVVYIVSSPVQPDASGWVRVTLYPKD